MNSQQTSQRTEVTGRRPTSPTADRDYCVRLWSNYK